MEIKTKFNVGDIVWYIDNNKVKSNQVARIFIFCDGSAKTQTQITYKPKDSLFSEYYESEVFASKEELLASL